MMKRVLVFLFAFIFLFSSCRDSALSPEEEIKSGTPVVTAECTDVTMDSAWLFGFVHSDYLVSEAKIGFILSSTPNPSLDHGERLSPVEIDKNNKFSIRVRNLLPSTTYYYRAYVILGSSYLVGESRMFTTDPFELRAIDLGFGIKWSNANLGATSPSDCGPRFAWGETRTKSEWTWENYKWCNGSSTTLTKYNNDPSKGIVDNKEVLEASDDAAHVLLGEKWRTPTYEELLELFSVIKSNSAYQCKYIFVNNQRGLDIYYTGNGNSIFLPTTGIPYMSDVISKPYYSYYLSSSINSERPEKANIMLLGPDSAYIGTMNRSNGLWIRPVTE